MMLVYVGKQAKHTHNKPWFFNMTTELYETIKSNLELIFEYGQTFEVRAINGRKICAGFFRDCETA